MVLTWPSRAVAPTAIRFASRRCSLPQELLGHLCAYAAALPFRARSKLESWFVSAECAPAVMDAWLKGLQQFITISVFQAERTATKADVQGVTDAIKFMAVVHAANVVAEKAGALKVEFAGFYNDAVNDELFHIRNNTEFVRTAYREWQADCKYLADRKLAAARGGAAEDYSADEDWRPASFLSYPFILSPATKAKVLQIDATQQMNRGVQSQLVTMMMSGRQLVPYLILRVRRDHVVEDAMRIIAQSPKEDLKKPLKVVFQGEEGIDEGGPAKEFMQIVTRELLDPQFAMFKSYDESRLLYFNAQTFEIGLEFELIGTLVGIAIFNSIILNLPFPIAVYKRLKDEDWAPTLDDLSELDPSLARSLEKMRAFDGDVEATFGQTFQVSVEAFGGVQTYELEEGGEEKPVTNANVKDYVEKYARFVLVDSVKAQLVAFRKGFMRVCGGTALELFRPEELELLVCGNPVLDFEALERCTHYEDGFEQDSAAMKHFWTVVHSFSEMEKRLLLKFFSGSDRAPIEGLSKMMFVISRQGPDSDQLPTVMHVVNTPFLARAY